MKTPLSRIRPEHIDKLITLQEAIDTAQGWFGRALTSRTLWRYVEAGWLPQGSKIRGRGNVTYFPRQVVLHLYAIACARQVPLLAASLDRRKLDILVERLKRDSTELPPLESYASALRDIFTKRVDEALNRELDQAAKYARRKLAADQENLERDWEAR